MTKPQRFSSNAPGQSPAAAPSQSETAVQPRPAPPAAETEPNIGPGLFGGTGMSMRPFKASRVVPGGDTEWGSDPGWVGFKTPIQALRNQVLIHGTKPEVGFHLQRTYEDPQNMDDGAVVSLMGEPCAEGHLFPSETPHAGYEFAAGNARA